MISTHKSTQIWSISPMFPYATAFNGNSSLPLPPHRHPIGYSVQRRRPATDTHMPTRPSQSEFQTPSLAIDLLFAFPF